MLFSYAQSREKELPKRASQFVTAAQILHTTTGIVLSPVAHQEYMHKSRLDREVQALIDAVTDEQSSQRVSKEIKRRVVTGKIPSAVGVAMTEAVEILGLQEGDLRITEVPLIVTIYPDQSAGSEGVVINVSGVKSLADALRLAWSKAYVSPHPAEPPRVASVVMRMPPAIATARVSRDADTIVVDAVEGWGRLVGTEETGDVFTLNADSLSFINRQVQTQEFMIARNERTQQVVKTSPFNASSQKITDDQVRGLAADLKRAGLSKAVFGLSNQKRWLLFIPQEHASQQIPEPAEQQESIAESFTDETEVEVVDLAEEEPASVAQEPAVQEESVEDFANEQEHSSSTPTQPEPVYTPQKESQQAQESPTQAKSASEHQAHVSRLGSELLEECLHTIEAAMREWLYDKDQPEEFGDLVARIASKRTVPYKQRVLSLWQIKRQGGFADPDAEAIRFGVETMQRFVREFS